MWMWLYKLCKHLCAVGWRGKDDSLKERSAYMPSDTRKAKLDYCLTDRRGREADR